MAETINLKKRLIGREDINFDITGTNETENFFTADGGQKKVSKINASHFPLTRNAREKLNATNVDEALVLLSEKVDDFEAADVLTEDITINFLSEDDIETIQNKINQQKKNLNGHTLTFVFPSSLAQNLYATLEWKDFFNGTVIITGGSSGSRITIYDRQNITSLFRIYRCLCEVRIEYFYFVHQHSPYAVSAESSSAVILKDCFFSGIEDADSYAVRLLASNGELADCQLSNDFDYDTLLSERLFEITEKNIEQDAQLNDLEENKAQTDLANVTANIDFVVESWIATDGLSWYRKYRSGWVEQGGVLGTDKASITLVFPVEFENTDYSFVTGVTNLTGDNYSMNTHKNSVGILSTKTVSSIEISNFGQTWFAAGKAATV
jgi:hypothetical protein